MRCPHCKSLNLVKRGRRKTKSGFKQLYQCKDCRLRFSDSQLANKTYPAQVILRAISYYNLGHSLESAARAVSGRYKCQVSKSSVGTWVRETASVCTYRNLRETIGRRYGGAGLISKTFEHGGLAYNFKYHQGKLRYLCQSRFPTLAQYVTRFYEQGCPDFFNSIPERCSQTKVRVTARRKNSRNQACRLAELALLTCRHNRERHERVEEFMLINDSSTVAVEVPVWLYERSLDARLNGHIDILQVRRGLIYVLDYKPQADKVMSQLYWYATGLAFRTKLPLEFFRCAWFDEISYFEFDPNEVRRG